MERGEPTAPLSVATVITTLIAIREMGIVLYTRTIPRALRDLLVENALHVSRLKCVVSGRGCENIKMTSKQD